MSRQCEKLKIPPIVKDRILGHVVGGVAGVYRTYTDDDEMAEALQNWSGALPAILARESAALRSAANTCLGGLSTKLV